jgi:site-specific recombinase XerD
MNSLAPTLEAYFTERLIRQRRASPHTVARYRDTFRLLLVYIQRPTGTPPSRLAITDLDTATIGAFLQHLEQERQNTARTRNIRLAAIHSFFHYCALRHPEHAALIQRVLAIPRKRAEKRTVTFLTAVETQALLDAPDRSTWAGRRDHALLLTAVQTGLRISELLGLTRADTQLATGQARCFPRAMAARSPATRSSGASPSTSRPHSMPARRCDPSGSRCTRCVTPRR